VKDLAAPQTHRHTPSWNGGIQKSKIAFVHPGCWRCQSSGCCWLNYLLNLKSRSVGPIIVTWCCCCDSCCHTIRQISGELSLSRSVLCFAGIAVGAVRRSVCLSSS